MGFFQNIIKAISPSGPPVPLISWVPGISNFLSLKRDRNFVDEYTGWVYACVNVIAESIANIEFVITKGGKTVDTHPVIEVISRANPFMTKFELLHITQAYIELDGNAFWYIVKDGKGQPLSIWPLRPDFVKVIPSETEYIDHYLYTVGNKKFKIPSTEMLHFKTFNPTNPYRGMGTVQASVASIDADNFSREWNAAFFANSARPDAVLKTTESLAPEEQDRLISAWKSQHQGTARAGNIGLLTGGLDIVPFQTSMKDMDFVEQRRNSRDEILAMFRVPKTILGIVEDVNYASAETTNYVFALRCIQPKMQRIVNTINEFFLPMFKDTATEISFVSPVPDNQEQKLARYASGLQMGWMTPNEVRVNEGLPKVSGGEYVYQSFGLSPLGKPSQEDTVEASFSNTQSKGLSGDIKQIAHMIAQNVKEAYQQFMSAEEFERRGAIRHKAVDERAKENEKELAKIMGTFLKGQKDRVIKNLEQEFGSKARKSKEDIFDIPTERDLLIKDVSSFFKTIVSSEGQIALDEAKIDDVFDADTARMKRILKSKTTYFANEVSKTTSRQIRDAIGEGLGEDEDLSKLTKRIGNLTAFDNSRSEMIARTEVIRTQNLASIEAWKQSEVVTKKIWYTALDERVCPYCDELHGKTIEIDRSFFKTGDTLDVGDDSMDLDYEDVEGPPLHPDCRCTVLPVVEGVKSQKTQKEVNKNDLLALYMKAEKTLDEYEKPSEE